MQALPHPLRVSLARARSLFRPLLPSACYAGYLTVYRGNIIFADVIVDIFLINIGVNLT